MKRRLLLSTLTIALVAVVTLGVPLLLLARHQVWTSARDTVRQQATSMAAGLEDRLDAGLPVDLNRYAQAFPGRHLEVLDPRGARHFAGPTLSGPVLQASVEVAGYTITVQAGEGPTVTRAREVTLLVAGLGMLAVTAAVGLALGQARRLGRPLSALVVRAEALGHGDFKPAPVDSGIPEIDGVSHVLENSSRRLAAMIEHQRDFAGDAAHQLRTPLTGIGLRLEEIARIGEPDVQQEADAAAAQVERLDRVITALLARASGDAAMPVRLALDQLAEHEAPVWAQALQRRGRTLKISVPAGLVVHARREHLAAVLSCLLDNALKHGDGRVTVTGRTRAGRVELDVIDQGPGVPAALAPHVFDRRVSGARGTGIGLALARSLATAEDGQLDLIPDCPSGFRLTLPPVPESSR